MYAKIHYEPPKRGAFAPPLPPHNPPLLVAKRLTTLTKSMLQSCEYRSADGTVALSVYVDRLSVMSNHCTQVVSSWPSLRAWAFPSTEPYQSNTNQVSMHAYYSVVVKSGEYWA